jgi:cysteine-rich repeat protein
VCEVGIDDDDSCNATCRRTRSPRCGNGVIEAPEGCDDGNSSDDDDCTNSCEIPQCGDGVVHDRQSGTEECDDGNAASGDGCSATCTRECGNGVLDFFCSEPESSAGQPCTSDAACDSVPSAGDGRCITGEVCDPGLAGLCVDDQMSPVCSNFCVIETCGNGLVECAEECDLGVVENADPGSGCTPGCTRSLAEEPSARECPAAFTVDLPPQPLPNQRETCRDGAACDFDQSVNGQCAFRIGVCLNLSEPGCTPGGLRTFDLLGVKIRGTCLAGRTGARCVVGQDCDTSAGAGDGNCVRDRAVVATTTLTDAVAALAPTGAASVPGRCRAGLKGKVCSVNNECDRAFGLGNGRCDIGTGVEFDPPLDGADQVGTCTPGQDIVVDAGSKLNLRSFVRRGSGPPDRDHLLLVCEP